MKKVLGNIAFSLLSLLLFNSQVLAQDGMVLVSGSGDSNANIIFQNTGGTTYYSTFDCDGNVVSASTYRIQKSGTSWELLNTSDVIIYTADFDLAKPPSTGWTVTTNGTGPAPVLSGDVIHLPQAANVTFSGTLALSQTLTGSYDYSQADNNPESGSTYQWYRADDSAGTDQTTIAGATDTSYIPTLIDTGKYLAFEVIPKDGFATGNVALSDWQGPLMQMEVSISAKSDVNCHGESDGSISLSISNGTAPYAINWGSGSGSNTNINNLTTGNYTITVTDKNGQSAQVSTIINEPSPLNAGSIQ